MKLGDIDLPVDAYVVVGEDDYAGADNSHGQPFVFETYLAESSLEQAVLRQKRMEGRFGKTCLAKLTFIGETND